MLKEQVIKNNQNFRFLLLFNMMYCTVLILSGLYIYRPVEIFGYQFAASCLIYPLSYPLNVIICDVYGYDNSKKLICFGMVVVFLFAFATRHLNTLPYPDSWNGKDAYDLIFSPYLRLSFAGLAGMVAGEFINIIFLSKFRKVFHGRFFIFRSISSTSIGSIVDVAAEYIIAFWGMYKGSKILEMLLIAYFSRVAYLAFLAFPASFRVIVKCGV